MAVSVAVTRTNLYTQVFLNVYNLLNDRSNVVDPLPRSQGRLRKFVYAREPSVDARGFDGYPLVVVNQPTIEVATRRLGDDKNAEVTGEMMIEVRSTTAFFRQGTSEDPHGKGLTFLNEISDDIMATLNSVANRNSLRANNIGFVKVESGSMDVFSVEAETVYVREMRLTFMTALLAVSS